MTPKDLDYTLTFKLADDGVKTIDELTKQQLEEAKKIIEKRLEDYEEPKKFWEIDSYGRIQELEKPADSIINPFWKKRLEIGNYFETREEAEKAVEKLRALKRLEDKGFSFCGWEDCNGEINTIYFSIPENKWETDTCDDLDICFGGEE